MNLNFNWVLKWANCLWFILKYRISSYTNSSNMKQSTKGQIPTDQRSYELLWDNPRALNIPFEDSCPRLNNNVITSPTKSGSCTRRWNTSTKLNTSAVRGISASKISDEYFLLHQCILITPQIKYRQRFYYDKSEQETHASGWLPRCYWTAQSVTPPACRCIVILWEKSKATSGVHSIQLSILWLICNLPLSTSQIHRQMLIFNDCFIHNPLISLCHIYHLPLFGAESREATFSSGTVVIRLQSHAKKCCFCLKMANVRGN